LAAGRPREAGVLLDGVAVDAPAAAGAAVAARGVGTGAGAPGPGCAMKKSYIAADSSGPVASAYCWAGLPPDQAWPMPRTNQYWPNS
jgi:hypothetical protein